MSQERYFDWRAPVKSKKAAEAHALTTGIGPKSGFNKLTIETVVPNATYDITVGSKKMYQDLYITDNANLIQQSAGKVITPDGILTNFKEEFTLRIDVLGKPTFQDSNGQYWEVLLTASHLYVEDETLVMNTSIQAKVNEVEVSSFYEYIMPTPYNPLGKTMESWFIHNLTSNVEKTTTVILGLYKIYTDGENYEAINPYNYIWPQSTIIPTSQLDHLISELALAKANTVPKGTLMPWMGSRVEEIPIGWLFCGTWNIGTGDADTISRSNAYGVSQGSISVSSMEIILNSFNTRHPGLDISLSSSQITSGVWRYYVVFNGKTVNGITIPNLRDRVITNTGFDIGETFGYQPGDIGGERSITLTGSQIPEHTHPIALRGTGDGSNQVESGGTSPDGTANTLTNQGGGQPHENRQPYYALPYIIKVI